MNMKIDFQVCGERGNTIKYDGNVYEYIDCGYSNFVFRTKETNTVIKYPRKQNELKSLKDLKNLKSIWNKLHGNEFASIIPANSINLDKDKIRKNNLTHVLSLPFVKGNPLLHIKYKIYGYLTRRGVNDVLSDEVSLNLRGCMWLDRAKKTAIVKPILDEIKNADTNNIDILDKYQKTINTAIKQNSALYKGSFFGESKQFNNCNDILNSCKEIVENAMILSK